MRVFLAGASGAIGSRLIPQLLAHGHSVIGTTRSVRGHERVTALGAQAVVLDLLDPRAVAAAVTAARPDAIVHEATALSGMRDFRHFDRTFATTNRLRTAGTDALLAAARETGVRRIVAQSYAAAYARQGGPVKSEDDPRDTMPPRAMRETFAAIRYLETAVIGAGGLALRYGTFYGLTTDDQIEIVRKQQFPVVGSGAGVWSFIHLDDAASATVLALDHGNPGAYNIVDDDPAPTREWLPGLAEAVGAKPPRHVPEWLGLIFAGEVPVVMMTETRGASNAKAKRELGWTLRYPSWRQGFMESYRSVRVRAAA